MIKVAHQRCTHYQMFVLGQSLMLLYTKLSHEIGMMRRIMTYVLGLDVCQRKMFDISNGYQKFKHWLEY